MALLAAVGWTLRQRAVVRAVPILMYHKTESGRDNVWWVSAEAFDAQLAHLRREGYRSILPGDLVANRRWGKPLPSKPVILTFDDGYLNTLTVAEPLLKKHGFRGIVYLATTYMGATPSERRAYEGVPMLTWQEVRDMRRRGTFAFGAHTRNHVDLRREERPFIEIRASRTDIRKVLGSEPRSFAYPFGIQNDAIARDVRKARFSTAMLCEDRLALVDGHTDLLRLPRVSVYGGAHAFEVDRAASQWTIRKTQGVPIPATLAFRVPGSEERAWVPVTGPDERLNHEPFAFDIPSEAVGRDGRTVVEVWGRSRVIPYFATTVASPPSLTAAP
jgi:peptidoglycan/xylan/chitin deacetylase (PgdA/CDA1 family)